MYKILEQPAGGRLCKCPSVAPGSHLLDVGVNMGSSRCVGFDGIRSLDLSSVGTRIFSFGGTRFGTKGVELRLKYGASSVPHGWAGFLQPFKS